MSGVFFFFSFSFPHLIVSWFVYSCQPIGVSCCYAVSMYACCMQWFRFAIVWVSLCSCDDAVVCVVGVCSVDGVANGLALGVMVVPDMGVLFHSWDGCGFWDIWFDLVL